jgi:hypothetical protein
MIPFIASGWIESEMARHLLRLLAIGAHVRRK